MLRPAEVRELPLYFVLHVAGFRPPGAESGIRFQFMHCLFPSVGAEQEDAETVDGAMPVLISKSDSVHIIQPSFFFFEMADYFLQAVCRGWVP